MGKKHGVLRPFLFPSGQGTKQEPLGGPPTFPGQRVPERGCWAVMASRLAALSSALLPHPAATSVRPSRLLRGCSPPPSAPARFFLPRQWDGDPGRTRAAHWADGYARVAWFVHSPPREAGRHRGTTRHARGPAALSLSLSCSVCDVGVTVPVVPASWADVDGTGGQRPAQGPACQAKLLAPRPPRPPQPQPPKDRQGAWCPACVAAPGR